VTSSIIGLVNVARMGKINAQDEIVGHSNPTRGDDGV